MEQPSQTGIQKLKAPRIPIETYRWEDIRRARLQGGYPWTYIYKEPFKKEINPDVYMMEPISKSKSSSPSLFRRIDIKDVSHSMDEHDSLTPEPSGYIVITEVPSDSESHSKPECSVIIKDIEDPEISNFESAESSDNISQYLDREETVIEDNDSPKEKQTIEKNVDNGKQRAKSEEPKQKRKLSIDSSYSRKSLSKLAFLKKIKQAKNKIKVPTLGKILPQTSNKFVKIDEPCQTSKSKPLSSYDPNAKPVYIYIPLKPPEGQVDKYSYLEYEDKKFEAIVPEVSKESEKIKVTKSNENNPDEIVAFEIVKTESIDFENATKNGLQSGNDYLIIQQDDDAKSENIIIMMPSNEHSSPTISRTSSKKSLSSRQESKRIRAKSAEPEKKFKLSLESIDSRRSLSKLSIIKKIKDAKDKLKFSKFTLSRSNSKKESKKLEPIIPQEATKKNEAKNTILQYIHIPLKPPEGEKDEFSYLEFEEKGEKSTTSRELVKDDQSSVESPLSVQNDDVQFIFLTPPSDDEILNQPEIPETPSSEAKPFFASRVYELRKIAQDAIDETSSQLKEKHLQPVEEEDGSGSSKTLNINNITGSKNVTFEEITTQENSESTVIDEEDGLKLTESAMASQEQNIKSKKILESDLKSDLKSDSPVLKKRVSFKRRSRNESKDGDYEDIQAPPEEIETKMSNSKIIYLETTQSMSVDEEKSYLDDKKIIKDTSLEEDYNRWSKLSDHEYEPVNPPPDDIIVSTPATTTISQIQQEKLNSETSSTTSLDCKMLTNEQEPNPKENLSTQEMQSQIENRYFNQTSKTTENSNVQEAPTLKTGSSKFQETVKSKLFNKRKEPTSQINITVQKTVTEEQPSKTEGPGRFQQAMKQQADKIKTKLHEIKKPKIKLPQKPKLKKPKINFPKIPDTTKINLPSFSLPRKNTTKQSLKPRQYSTESNAGDSKKSYFNFKTYPRLFKNQEKKGPEPFNSTSEQETPELATVPRIKRKNDNEKDDNRDSIRISLHAKDSFESNEREDSVERRMASHMKYEENFDIDDAYQKENQEIDTASPFSHDYRTRWNHGSFHADTSLNLELNTPINEQQMTDLYKPICTLQENFDINISKDGHSSESSLGVHRRGVLEEIDSDEFFLRQKGISQDNIEVGAYLSSEIKEAFKSPTNALADLHRPLDYTRSSNQSLPETPTKRKPIKKPKRRKTPHVSHEQISFDDEESEQEMDTDISPSRPKRRNKKNKKNLHLEQDIITYKKSIPVEEQKKEEEKVEEENVLVCKNIKDNEQPDINFYYDYEENYDSEDDEIILRPATPPRKQRSLNFSEHESMLSENYFEKEKPLDEIEVYITEHEYFIPTPEIPPTKPPRTISRSSSKSLDKNQEDPPTPPIRPERTRSNSRTRSQADSLPDEPVPCVEEICVQDFRDCMGYAVVDKNQKRYPPLPPPRTSPKHKKSNQSSKSSITDIKFFTVPRQLNDEPPTRPLRNYSTLGPSRPPRRKHIINMTDEEKENIDITQYIEIDDEPNRDLHSGKVIQKMRDRPLPAPPRPPRKTKVFQDISSLENISGDPCENEQYLEKTTDISSEHFVCKEKQKEAGIDKVPDRASIEKRIITPSKYIYEEETITHGSLIVQPLNDANILPDSEIIQAPNTTERNVFITKEYDDETSEIPEEFTKLQNPPASALRVETSQSQIAPSVQTDPCKEIEVLKAQKLEVNDLDVDRLSVNELLASKIIVSEIDSEHIQTKDISSKSGALKIGEIELPPSVVQELINKLQTVTHEQRVFEPKELKIESENAEQKKSPINKKNTDSLPPSITKKNLDVESDITLSPELDTESKANKTIDVEYVETSSIIVEKEEIKAVLEVASFPEPPIRTDSCTILSDTLDSVINHKELEPTYIQSSEPSLVEELQSTISSEITSIQETTVDVLSIQNSVLLVDQNIIEKPDSIRQIPPQRPPRQSEKLRDLPTIEGLAIDDEPPPRPPDPQIDYIPSQPPASFYALKAQQYVDNLDNDTPAVLRRRRHHKARISRSRSTSDDSPIRPPSRRRYRSPEANIPQLAGQLVGACGTVANSLIKRLITHISNNLLRNADGQQDMHVTIVILLILIAGLILLGYGDEKTVHYHHWEYFNPPRDM